MVNEIYATDCLSDQECDALRGKYLDDSSYDRIISEDTDYYHEGNVIFKFRKNFRLNLLLTQMDFKMIDRLRPFLY